MIRVKTIRARFTIYIILFTMVTLLILLSYVINLYSSKLLEDMKVISRLQLEIVSDEMEKSLNEIYQIFQTIQDNDDLQEVLVRPLGSDYNDGDRKHDVSEILREYAYADINIISIFFIDGDKGILDPFYQIEPYSSIVSHYQPLKDYYEKKGTRITPIGRFPLKEEEEEGIDTITMIDELLSKEAFAPLGTLLITSKVDFIFEDFAKTSKDNFDGVFVVNQSGDLIYYTGKEELGVSQSLFDAFSQSGVIGNEEGLIDVELGTFFVSTQVLESYSDWMIIGVKEYTELQSNYNDVMDILILLGMLSIPVLLVFSYIYARRITGPIVKLNMAMQEFSKGEWPDKVKPESQDEMGQLVEKFNDMVDHQFELIDQIVKEQEVSKAKEIETIQLKLDLLQSQINPHFIHNTLHAISYLIGSNMNGEANEMLKAFNVLLRSSMSHQKDSVTLEEELNHVKSYVMIQKVRYNDVFVMEYHIDDHLRKMEIPKLTIQPLVENAIYHGIVPKGQTGRISISAMEMDSGLVTICVEDDGVGMDPEKRLKLKQSFNGISFENINKRLKLTYGEDAGLVIESVKGKGTKVTFTIKKKV